MKKYEIIYNDILSKIEYEEYKLGTAIPSENSLSNHYNYSRVTVRKALTELSKNGFISKHQGKTCIVTNTVAKPKTVLLILPDLFKYIFIDLIKAIETILHKDNIQLMIACSYNDQKTERRIIRSYLNVVDGIILEPTQAKKTNYAISTTYSALESKPTVCINSKLINLNVPYLELDDRNNMRIVSNYVLQRGCKRILILSKTDDLQGYARLAGIKDIFDTSNTMYKTVEFTTQNQNQKIAEFGTLYFNYKPDCIIFYNDEYAYRLMNQFGISPNQNNICIIGYDNTEYSNGQPFTFVSPNHPKAVMGEDAANMIISLLNGKAVESITYESDINFDKHSK